MKTIETRGRRGVLGIIILTIFVIWNAVMALMMIGAIMVPSSKEMMQLLTPDQQFAARGDVILFVIFLWSVSDLVLGTFVLWTRGPKIWTTMDDTAVSPPRAIAVTPETWEAVKAYSDIEQRRAKWAVSIAGAVLALLALAAAAHADNSGDATRQPDSAPPSSELDDPDPFTWDGHCKPGRVSCFEIAPEDGDEAEQPRNDAAGIAAMRAVHDALDKLDSRTPSGGGTK